MEKDTSLKLNKLKVDGGASQNNFLMQFQADIINTEVIRPSIMESTALGVAFLAGLKEGIFSSLDQIIKLKNKNNVFVPNMDNNIREEYIHNWHKAVNACINWSK